MEQIPINKENFKEEMPPKLADALSKLFKDGNITPISVFIKNNGKRETPYEIVEDSTESERLGRILFKDLRALELKSDSHDYNRTLWTWGKLKDVGILSADILKNAIDKFITEWMNLSGDEIEKTKADAKKLHGGDIILNEYSNEFLQEFTENLESRIKNSLGWDIKINYKKK